MSPQVGIIKLDWAMWGAVGCTQKEELTVHNLNVKDPLQPLPPKVTSALKHDSQQPVFFFNYEC